MDGVIDISQVGFCSLPFFIALGFYLFITVSLIADPYYFNNKRLQYFTYLQPGVIDNRFKDKNWSYDNIDNEDGLLDVGWTETINLMIYHLWIWLLFILGYISKYIWFASVYSPFSLLFIPCHVFCIAYCVGPLIFYRKHRAKNAITHDSKVMSYCTYFTNNVIVILSSVQILLIGLKLDNGMLLISFILHSKQSSPLIGTLFYSQHGYFYYLLIACVVGIVSFLKFNILY